MLHPTWDVALVKVDSAFDINGSPTYPNFYPNRALVCHGVECMTTQTALAKNSGLDTSWAPCGGYRSSWEAQVSLENNADFFYVYGRTMTGDNTFTGIAPGGTIQLQLRTTGSDAERRPQVVARPLHSVTPDAELMASPSQSAGSAQRAACRRVVRLRGRSSYWR